MTVSARNAQRLRLPLTLRAIGRAAEAFVRRMGSRGAGELAIIFLTAPKMRRLNRRALGHDYVTDVVTFDLTEPTGPRPKAQGAPGHHGARCRVPGAVTAEIYICPAQVKRNARIYGEPFARELLRCVAHGILHLRGLDDRTPRGCAQMRGAEADLLESVGQLSLRP